MILLIQSNQRVFICGKTGSGKTYWAKKILSTFPRYILYDPYFEYGELGFICHNTKSLLHALDKQARIVYQPINDSIIEFTKVCYIVFACENLVFAVDEVPNYATTHQIPAIFSKIIRIGRKKGIGCFMIAQRTAHVHKDCISQAEHIVCFRQHLTQDVDYLKSFIGDWALRLRDIPDWHYLHFDHSQAVFYPPI